MSHTQEYKIINNLTKMEVFFFEHSLKTAYVHALDYIKRNADQSLTLYRLNRNIGAKWLKVRL